MSHTLLENAPLFPCHQCAVDLQVPPSIPSAPGVPQLSGSRWYPCADDGKTDVLGLSWDSSSTAVVSQCISEHNWEYPRSPVLLSNALMLLIAHSLLWRNPLPFPFLPCFREFLYPLASLTNSFYPLKTPFAPCVTTAATSVRIRTVVHGCSCVSPQGLLGVLFLLEPQQWQTEQCPQVLLPQDCLVLVGMDAGGSGCGWNALE